MEVKHDRKACIGCGACVVIHPESWKMAKDGRSDLIDCEELEGDWQRKTIADDNDHRLHKEAAENCPTSCIHLKK